MRHKRRRLQTDCMSSPLFYTLTNTCPWVAPWVLWTSKHAFTLSKPLDNGQLDIATATAVSYKKYDSRQQAFIWFSLDWFLLKQTKKRIWKPSFASVKLVWLAVIFKISFGHFTCREWDRQNTQKALNRHKFSIEKCTSMLRELPCPQILEHPCWNWRQNHHNIWYWPQCNNNGNNDDADDD